jgi:uncharacterized protein (DUF2164 family)
MEVNRGLVDINKKDRDALIKSIIYYFYEERSEKIGVIAAGGFLDFFVEKISPYIYNKAIEDSKLLIKKEMEGLDFELDLLRK